MKILSIRTTYKGPTNAKGSRFIAEGMGHSKSVSYDYSLNSNENHLRSAQELLNELKLKGKLTVTHDNLQTGYRFIVTELEGID